jgi:hypothetical protein
MLAPQHQSQEVVRGNALFAFQEAGISPCRCAEAAGVPLINIQQ